jgi:hypothetical protein
MAATPPATPVTTPVVDTVAVAVLLDVHVPPVVASVRVIVEPIHTSDGPAIAAGNG